MTCGGVFFSFMSLMRVAIVGWLMSVHGVVK